jgi:hypothetical protein
MSSTDDTSDFGVGEISSFALGATLKALVSGSMLRSRAQASSADDASARE